MREQCMASPVWENECVISISKNVSGKRSHFSGLSSKGGDNRTLSAFPLFFSARLTDGVWCSRGWIPTCISFGCSQVIENTFLLGLTFQSHPKGGLF